MNNALEKITMMIKDIDVRKPVKFARSKVLAYNGSPPGVRTKFNYPEYDMKEVARAYDSITGDRPIVVRLDGRVMIEPVENLFRDIPGRRYEIDDREYIEPDGILEALSHDESSRLDWRNLPEWFINDHLTGIQIQAYNALIDGTCSRKNLWYSVTDIRKKVRKWNRLCVSGKWAVVPYLTRHHVSKRLFTVRSKFGETTVTEDHGLITYADGFFQQCTPLDDRYEPVSVHSIPESELDSEIDLSDYIEESELVTLSEDRIFWAKNPPNSNYRPFSFDRKFSINDSKAISFARLLGAYLSEGSVNSGNRKFRIASSNREWLEELAIDFYLVFEKRPSMCDEPSGMSHLDVCGELICNIFSNAGGRLSSGKKIPSAVFHWPRMLRSSLIQTLLEGDGTVDIHGTKSLTTKSKLLASGFQILLKMDGIGTSINYKKAWGGRTYYTILAREDANSMQYNFNKIEVVEQPKTSDWVYDLEVEDTHTFVDGVGNLLLHNTEPLFARAADKYAEQIMKNDFDLVSKNPQAAAYMRQRLAQISRVSGVTTHQLLSAIAENISIYSNAFVLKVRNEDASGGNEWHDLDGKRRRPIAGLYPIDPTSLRVAIDQNGRILKWRQEIPGATKFQDFAPDDIVHFAYNKKTGLVFGTPMVWPVIDDIRALRRMEENVELLIYQHAVPLFHFKIGSQDLPGDYSEVLEAQTLWNSMPSEGMIITTERYEIESVGVDGSAINAEPYLEYYRQRIFMGLGVSEVVMGLGGTSNRSTSTNLVKEMQNRTSKIQRLIKDIFDHEILFELLREGNLEWDEFDPFNKVELHMVDIDFDERMKKENHFIDAYLKNAITEPEMRKELGRDPITDPENTNFMLHEVPIALIGSGDETSGLGAEATSSVGKTTNLGLGMLPDAGSDNKTRPENQHGKKAAATRAVNKDEAIPFRDRVAEPNFLTLIQHDAFLDKIQNQYQMIKNESMHVVRSLINAEHYSTRVANQKLTMIVSANRSRMEEYSELYLGHAYTMGFRNSNGGNFAQIENSTDKRILVETGERFLRYFTKDLNREVKNNVAKSTKDDIAMNLRTLFDSQNHRVEKFTRFWSVKAYNMGLARGFHESGHTTVHVNVVEGCETCTEKEIELGDILDFNDLPAYHPNCLCTIGLRSDTDEQV